MTLCIQVLFYVIIHSLVLPISAQKLFSGKPYLRMMLLQLICYF